MRATPRALELDLIGSGMMPPTKTGTSDSAALAQQLGDAWESASDASRSGSTGRRHRRLLRSAELTICSGREADAVVDHLEAGFLGAHRHLLGAVRVAVEARLGHQQPDRMADLAATTAGGRAAPPRMVAASPENVAPCKPRRRAVLAEYCAEACRAHSPVVTPACAARIDAGMMFVRAARRIRRARAAPGRTSR